jgi:hypothetical protein
MCGHGTESETRTPEHEGRMITTETLGQSISSKNGYTPTNDVGVLLCFLGDLVPRSVVIYQNLLYYW